MAGSPPPGAKQSGNGIDGIDQSDTTGADPEEGR